KNIGLNVIDTLTNRKIYTDFGEMQLMKYGVSGAVILSASSHIREMQSGRYRMDIDLKPALSEEKLDTRLLREISERKLNDFEYLMHAFLPKQMIEFFIEKSGIPANKKCSEISRIDRKNVISLLKQFSLTVKSYRPLEEAIITSGGVDVKEIEPKTMESKLIKGLYFAGEVIDVDCYTGGFNLQTAFSTGVLAGEN
ncbi:MAG: aminoacetone oxidase family FAD-binding enzyme, partial [Clostridia bacterium]|nr:aminoacetone oxidase family FAD-binding enzyme [Clostridia bacterium]